MNVPAALLLASAVCASSCASARDARGHDAGRPDGWAKVWLTCSAPDAEVTVDGAPAGHCADYAGRQLRVRPGRHRLEIRSGGSIEQRAMELGPGDDVSLTIALSPPPVAGPARVAAGAGSLP